MPTSVKLSTRDGRRVESLTWPPERLALKMFRSLMMRNAESSVREEVNCERRDVDAMAVGRGPTGAGGACVETDGDGTEGAAVAGSDAATTGVFVGAASGALVGAGLFVLWAAAENPATTSSIASQPACQA